MAVTVSTSASKRLIDPILGMNVTHLGLRRSSDSPDTVQSITRFHSLFLLHLTGANNPVPSADVELAV